MSILILLIVSVILIVIPIQTSFGLFKVIVEVNNATSEHGEYKIKVKLENGNAKASKSKTVNIGEDALYWDESELSYLFKFKHSGVGDWFKACISNSEYKQCERGINSIEKRPEIVTLEVDR